MIYPSAVTKNPLVRLLISPLPARMKRVVFLASLTAIAKQTTVPEKTLINKLNRVLNLSTTGDAALKFPMHVSKLIWEDKQVFQEDIKRLMGKDCSSAESYAQSIVESTPPWLKYADRQGLIDDVVMLFADDNCIFRSAQEPALN